MTLSRGLLSPQTVGVVDVAGLEVLPKKQILELNQSALNHWLHDAMDMESSPGEACGWGAGGAAREGTRWGSQAHGDKKVATQSSIPVLFPQLVPGLLGKQAD